MNDETAKNDPSLGEAISEVEFAQGVLDSLFQPAILINRDYEVLLSNEPYRHRYGLLSKGPKRKCHQISHHYDVPCDQAGESCPLKTSLETQGRARTLHIHYSSAGEEYVNVEMWPIRNPTTGEPEYFIEQIFELEDVVAVDPAAPTLLVGVSPPFRQMIDLVQRVAPSEASVLLLGETGTGKELVAQMIHQMSGRSEAPFVPVECTGLPESLFESELFGYVKGAFTGANTDKTGLVEAANGGTLFLDEVGEIPLQDQVKLLRLLETRRYRRIGSPDWCNADFRLVSATNRDLKAMVAEGTFRADLYYRLSVFEIILPPLRDRQRDIPLLVERMQEELRRPDVHFADETLQYLVNYDYPGNVRELRNLVERSILMADDQVVLPQHLPPLLLEQEEGGAVVGVDEVRPLEDVEREYLHRVVSRWQGDRKTLAQKLGLSERALYRKIAALKK